MILFFNVVNYVRPENLRSQCRYVGDLDDLILLRGLTAPPPIGFTCTINNMIYMILRYITQADTIYFSWAHRSVLRRVVNFRRRPFPRIFFAIAMTTGVCNAPARTARGL